LLITYLICRITSNYPALVKPRIQNLKPEKRKVLFKFFIISILIGLLLASCSGSNSTYKTGDPIYSGVVLGDSVGFSLAFSLGVDSTNYGLKIADDAIIGCGVTGMQVTERNDRGAIGPVPNFCYSWEETDKSNLTKTHASFAIVLDGRWECLDSLYNGRWTNLTQPVFQRYIADQFKTLETLINDEGAIAIFLTFPYENQGLDSQGKPWPQDSKQRIDILNSIIRQVVQSDPGKAAVIDFNRYVDPNGQYVSKIDGFKLRDGVHFSIGSGKWLQPWLLPQVYTIVANFEHSSHSG
jgi:hypothetical protein